jgi:hypothetical protein
MGLLLRFQVSGWPHTPSDTGLSKARAKGIFD